MQSVRDDAEAEDVRQQRQNAGLRGPQRADRDDHAAGGEAALHPRRHERAEQAAHPDKGEHHADQRRGGAQLFGADDEHQGEGVEDEVYAAKIAG